MNKIIPIFKPEGITPFDLIRAFKRKFPEYFKVKISPAGRLDPMASGLILLLVDQANKNRIHLQALDKTYRFSLLLGVATDTYDILGKVTSIESTLKIYPTKKLGTLLEKFTGTFSQTYPPYSSIHVNKKPLFYWARENKLAKINIPAKIITIKSLSATSSGSLDKNELITNVEDRINKVKGDFRQDEILKIWHDSAPNLPKRLQLFQLKAEVSSGTYIRALCHLIGEKTGLGGLAYSIERTSIGEYTLDQALYLNGK